MKTFNFLKTVIPLLLFNPVCLSAGIFENLQPIQIITGLQFTESPEWHPDGYLVFSDVTGNTIYKWSETAGLQTLANPSGNANGIIATKLNDFVVCRQGLRDVAKMDTLGNFTSLMSTWDGKKLNAPNDVALSYLGSIYFTDPDFGTTNCELTFQGLYCIPYNSTTPFLLDSTLIKPKGLTFVQDWKTLYVNESSTNTIYSYGLKYETSIDLTKDKKVFLKVDGTGEIDGITADVFGNLFVACGDGGVKIYDKSAALIDSITIPTGERVRNLSFGGKYKNLLFITAGESVYKVEIRYYGDFIATGILSIPSDKSINFNALSDKNMTAYIAYGTNATNLSMQTASADFTANQPINITIDGLTANTKYYYQLYYHLSGETDFKDVTSGSFMTQRSQGQAFSFAVEADPHLDENSYYSTFRNTLQNELKLNPDFLIDLGDNFMSEKLALPNYYNIEQRNLLYRNFWDNVCNSMPLYLVVGNHEGELGWLNFNQPTDVFNMTTALRKRYYPGPQANDFYSANETNDLIQGQMENYYAWNWGDALFVVIDPYAYTNTKPTDAWGFTLGKTQYDWFRSTLENSIAKYKFVFAHQLVGGDKDGRGGAERVHLAEMGGQNADSTYGFDTQRSGWGKPIHQIMVENGVQIYFHGHDHLYVEQTKDGIVYLEVPQPSLSNYTSTTTAPGYGYVTGVILSCSGHINVTVSSDSAKVDYISGYTEDNVSAGQVNGTIRRTFYVKAKNTGTAIDSPNSERSNLQIYQSGQTIFMKSTTESDVYPKLFSLTGEEIYSFGRVALAAQTSELQLPKNLVSGVYILSVNSKYEKTTLKIVF